MGDQTAEDCCLCASGFLATWSASVGLTAQLLAMLLQMVREETP